VDHDNKLLFKSDFPNPGVIVIADAYEKL